MKESDIGECVLEVFMTFITLHLQFQEFICIVSMLRKDREFLDLYPMEPELTRSLVWSRKIMKR